MVAAKIKPSRSQPRRELRCSKALAAGGTQQHAGALVARGEVLWFVHADTSPPRDAISEIDGALRDSSVVGGNFGLTFEGPSRAARQLTAIYPTLRWLNLCYGDSGIFVRRTT